MAKKATRKTRIFELDGDVKVTVEGPAESVRWQATHNSLSIATGDATFLAQPLKQEKIVPTSSGESVPQTNGPDHDTPAIIAARAKLPDVLGGPRKFARGTSEEAFAQLGIDLAPGELTPENLEAAETFGGNPVV